MVFFSMILVAMPPNVSTPSERGVTSRRRISFTSPARTAPCIAAPIATASIGSTPLSAGFPMVSSTNFLTRGIRVIPPMRITLSMSFGVSLASCITRRIGSLALSTIGRASSSNLDLERT